MNIFALIYNVLRKPAIFLRGWYVASVYMSCKICEIIIIGLLAVYRQLVKNSGISGVRFYCKAIMHKVRVIDSTWIN
jgi:hypothetical protein